jgi:glycerol-3-phosphate acyltransferase PlsY
VSVPHDIHASAVATCACWAGAFVLGSIPLGLLLARTRLRRDLRRLERGGRRRAPVDLFALLAGGGNEAATPLPGPGEVIGAVLDTAKVLGLAFAALVIVRAASPAFRRGDVPPASAVGFVTNQLLTLWQSASLWAGLAAGVGHLWSVWLGFRASGQAQAPLMALAVRFTPTSFVVAVVGYFVGRFSLGPRMGVVTSLVAFVGWTWASWLLDLPHWWGFPLGPEVGLWAAVLAGVVAARNLGGSAAPAGA